MMSEKAWLKEEGRMTDQNALRQICRFKSFGESATGHWSEKSRSKEDWQTRMHRFRLASALYYRWRKCIGDRS